MRELPPSRSLESPMPNAFNFRDLDRVEDGFFVKLSYLFRM